MGFILQIQNGELKKIIVHTILNIIQIKVKSPF